MYILMQLAVTAKDLGKSLTLCWRPREVNQEADSLTNEVFTGFDMSRRICCAWSEVRRDVLDTLLAHAKAFAD